MQDGAAGEGVINVHGERLVLSTVWASRKANAGCSCAICSCGMATGSNTSVNLPAYMLKLGRRKNAREVIPHSEGDLMR